MTRTPVVAETAHVRAQSARSGHSNTASSNVCGASRPEEQHIVELIALTPASSRGTLSSDLDSGYTCFNTYF